VKPHSTFLREGSVLPSGFDLRQEKFIENWMSIRDTTAFALDIKIRVAGWHFFWVQDVHNSSAVGRSEASASSYAIVRSLKKVREPFNAAEIQLITIKRYLGFWFATVMLITRHIQIGSTI
jgi:hypothetical protein